MSNTTTQNQSDMQIRTAMAVLPEIRSGKFVEELTKACAEVAMSVVANEGKGEIAIKLKFQPGPGSDNAIAVLDEIKTKPAQPKKRPTVLFLADDGSISREDPNQPELGLNVAPINQGPKRLANNNSDK